MTVSNINSEKTVLTRSRRGFTAIFSSNTSLFVTTYIVPILRPLQYVLYIVARVVPRDRKLWVFGSWGGARYADNAAALFKYSNMADKPKVRCIWITQQRAICNSLRSQGYEAHMALSLAGFLYSLRAGVYVFDGLTKDINHWTSNGAKRVLLRHGVGIKKIEREIDQKDHRLFKLFHGKWWQKIFWSFLLPWHRVRPDLVLASSETHANQAVRFFDVPVENTAITGMPRTDTLFEDEALSKIPKQIMSWIESSRRDNRAIVLYLPTFRDDGSSSVPFDWSTLDSMLANTQANLLFKPHPADKSTISTSDSNYKHVCIIQADVDTSALLPLADCFVTDYSSVVYDFMLLRRPVIFFCPDLKEYQRFSRTLDIPYDEATPGEKVRTLAHLVDVIKDTTSNDVLPHQVDVDYERVLSLFHSFDDGHSSRRAHDEICKRFVSS